MGLATPTSIMVATGRAASLGILLRRGEALQALRDTTLIAFDKTGTLTEGKPSLTDLHPAPGFEKDSLFAMDRRRRTSFRTSQRAGAGTCR